MGSEDPFFVRKKAYNDKEVITLKKADNQVIVIFGNNNKVSIGGGRSHFSLITFIALAIIAVVVVLAIWLCCPDLLADFVRWLISNVIGG